MKKRIVKEVELDVCDICESEVDKDFYGLIHHIDEGEPLPYIGMGEEHYDLCRDCYTNVLKPFLESKKLTK